MTRKIALSVLCLLLTVLALFSGWKIYSEISARQNEKMIFRSYSLGRTTDHRAFCNSCAGRNNCSGGKHRANSGAA